MEKRKLWGFLKRCSSCARKIAPTNGHALCLFCLGETHNVETCAICSRFSRQAKRNRAARLGVYLLEQSLRPHKKPMKPKAAETSASASTPTIGVTAAIRASPSASKASTPGASSSPPKHVTETTAKDPVKIILPLSAQPIQQALPTKDRDEKQKKTKSKSPKTDATQSSHVSAPKPKKRKHLQEMAEASVPIIPHPGSLPLDELFQTPKRDPEVASTRSRKVSTGLSTQDQLDSDDSVVSLSSASEAEERLSKCSHPVRLLSRPRDQDIGRTRDTTSMGVSNVMHHGAGYAAHEPMLHQLRLQRISPGRILYSTQPPRCWSPSYDERQWAFAFGPDRPMRYYDREQGCYYDMMAVGTSTMHEMTDLTPLLIGADHGQGLHVACHHIPVARRLLSVATRPSPMRTPLDLRYARHTQSHTHSRHRSFRTSLQCLPLNCCRPPRPRLTLRR